MMLGVATTVNVTPLLATPPTATTTLPVVAPAGTGTVIEDDCHRVGVPAVPLNFTVLDPWLEPKLDPAMVTEVPTEPEAGDRLLILGAAATAEGAPNKIKRSRADEAM